MGRKKADLWPLEDLARRVWEERSQIIRIGQDDHPPYYMTNLRHPTIRVLYDQWRKSEADGPTMAPGDLERIAWELSLMSQETLAAIQRHFEAVDEMEQKLRKERDHE